MRIAAPIATALVALALSFGTALACSCLRPASAAAHLESANLVFKGAAVSETRSGDGEAETVFRVEEMLKGRRQTTIAVRHRLESASCGVTFQRGVSVLVIARQGDDGVIRTSLCTQPMFPEAEYRRALARQGRGAPAARCDAQPARFAVGRRYTPDLGRQAQRASGAASLRVRRPGRAYTEDLRSDRLNLDLNRASRVRRAVCE